MIFQIKTLRKILAFLEEYQIPFVVIGGIANRDWLTQFAETLEKPEIFTRFNQLYETV